MHTVLSPYFRNIPVEEVSFLNQLPAFLSSQNASAGVSRMLLGNKCDIEAKRKVSKDTGEKVR